MASEIKTKETTASVKKFIDALPDTRMRKDCRTIVALMKRVTKAAPRMWGSSIVGFGRYRYVYASGQEADWPLAAFSPRKQNLTIYLMPGFTKYDTLMNNLGPHKTGKVCLYLKSLLEIDMKILERLIRLSVIPVKQTVKERSKKLSAQ